MEARNGRTFAQQAQGREPQAIDVTLARLNADVYRNPEAGNPGASIDGWTPLNDEQLRSHGIRPGMLDNDHTGFHARIYSDGQGHYVLAYRGTDEGQDWMHNLRQGVGLQDAQYDQAVMLARKAHQAFGEELVITGHSLGGGLAATAAVATDTPAVIFNAAGVHANTLERLGLDPERVRAEAANGQIRRYSVNNEILTQLQEHTVPTRWVMPDAIGHRIDLPDPDPQGFWQRMVPGSSLRHGIEVHGMDAVLRAQQMTQPQASLDSPDHPGNALYQQAFAGLQRLDRNSLGLHTDQDMRNAAASLAAQAQLGGLRRIDHVASDTSGNVLFAVEGRVDDPAHLRVNLGTTRAMTQPLEQSAAQLQQHVPAEPAAQVERESRRLTMP